MRRVVKIGGSLLLREDLPDTLRGWFAAQRPAENIVIVGGGELIDAIRRLDGVRPGNPADIHWRCVDLLGQTFQTLCEWFPEWDRVESSEGFQRGVDFGFSSGKPTLLKVSSFYHRNDHSSLPLDWRTTTDAIAGSLGIKCHADEVVLLKSCDVIANMSFDEMSANGIVDDAFPSVANELTKVRIEQLPPIRSRTAK